MQRHLTSEDDLASTTSISQEPKSILPPLFGSPVAELTHQPPKPSSVVSAPHTS
jgi:hypothetical protein